MSDRTTNRILAASVFLLTSGLYLALCAPSICFWDAAEYVAAGSTLGIPHPPGNPLYILIARIASIGLSFLKNPAQRITVVTPLSSAAAAMFAYLTIVRVLNAAATTYPKTKARKAAVYLGGLAGSLCAASGATVLASALEAEVNAVLLLPLTLCMWLAVAWAQDKSPGRDRFLVMTAYVSFLGIGIHMYSMIVLIPVFLFVILVDPVKRTDWRFWLTALCMGLVMFRISLFLWAGPLITIIALVASLGRGTNHFRWRFCFWIAMAACIGFSVHLSIPVRSSLHPRIDEYHGSSVQAFAGYLDRKQYGSESKILEMFRRKGSLKNQFGIESRMGFGGFFLTQFFRISRDDIGTSFFAAGMATGLIKLCIYLLPVAWMILGWFFLFRKSRKLALFLILLTIVTTIGLVLYMNFADGTRLAKYNSPDWFHAGEFGQEPVFEAREVRSRDYFFIAGFFLYGMWIGLTAGVVLLRLLTSQRKALRVAVAPIAMILVAVCPALPIVQNIQLTSRRGDFISHDYAHNLLMSCEKNGILFTLGDNETFPLWALQEAFGIRRDITILNMSLLNDSWYIKQLKKRDSQFPIALGDPEIDSLVPEPNPFFQPEPYRMPGAAIQIEIPSQTSIATLRVQDRILLHIVDVNSWKRPVYFAPAISARDLVGLDSYLSAEGMVLRLTPDRTDAQIRVNLPRTEFLVDSVYQFRGLTLPRARFDETSRTMIHTYSTLALQFALGARQAIALYQRSIDSLATAGKAARNARNIARLRALQDTALRKGLARIDNLSNRIPHDSRIHLVRHELLQSSGHADRATHALLAALRANARDTELLKSGAQLLSENGNDSAALEVLRMLTTADPRMEYGWYALGKAYQKADRFGEARESFQKLRDLTIEKKQADALIEENELLRNE